jgi:hypothetical protein
MPQVAAFRLCEEHRRWLENCLTKANVPLIEPVDKFLGRIRASINAFLCAERETPLRESHDALRKLWQLAHDPDPAIGQLRSRLRSLPPRALHYIDGRARRVIPRLFVGNSCENGLIAWADVASGDMLVRAVRVLSAEGGRPIPGRLRAKGKRSTAHLEPVIFGQARGALGAKPKGGRPVGEARHAFVMNLAMDWHFGTGDMPQSGRSDGTGFGQMVHLVFDWLQEAGAEEPCATIGAMSKRDDEAKKPDGWCWLSSGFGQRSCVPAEIVGHQEALR